MELFSVFDSLAERWYPPMTLENEAMAVRAFVSACDQADSPMKASPMDFCLFRIGAFDPQTGEVLGCTPVRVISALEAVHVLAARKGAEDKRQLKLAGGEN